MNAMPREMTEDEFEEQLNDLYGKVIICGQEFSAGSAYRELDPTGFDTALDDQGVTGYDCGECGTAFYEEDDAQDCCEEEEEEEDDLQD